MPVGADTFTFVGPEAEVGYYAYRDLSTGKMLIGEPGYTCPIAATDVGPRDADGNVTQLPVPPADGRWVASGTADAKAAVKAAKAAQAAADAEAAQDAKGDTSTSAGDESTPGSGS